MVLSSKASVTTSVAIEDKDAGRGRDLKSLSASAIRVLMTLVVNWTDGDAAPSTLPALSAFSRRGTPADTAEPSVCAGVTARGRESKSAAGALDCACIAPAERRANTVTTIRARTFFIKYHLKEGYPPGVAAILRFADGTFRCQQLF